MIYVKMKVKIHPKKQSLIIHLAKRGMFKTQFKLSGKKYGEINIHHLY